jgi:hypothetical protein
MRLRELTMLLHHSQANILYSHCKLQLCDA